MVFYCILSTVMHSQYLMISFLYQYRSLTATRYCHILIIIKTLFS